MSPPMRTPAWRRAKPDGKTSTSRTTDDASPPRKRAGIGRWVRENWVPIGTVIAALTLLVTIYNPFDREGPHTAVRLEGVQVFITLGKVRPSVFAAVRVVNESSHQISVGGVVFTFLGSKGTGTPLGDLDLINPTPFGHRTAPVPIASGDGHLFVLTSAPLHQAFPSASRQKICKQLESVAVAAYTEDGKRWPLPLTKLSGRVYINPSPAENECVVQNESG